MMNEWLTRLRFLFTRRKTDELEEELRFHVEQSVERKHRRRHDGGRGAAAGDD